MKTFEANEELIKIFREHGVRFAYIFGSQLTGEAGEESDVDLAVMLPQNLSAETRFEHRLALITEISRILKKPVDLVVLNDVQSLLLKYVIVTEGHLIHSASEGERAEFECRTMGLYWDWAPFLEEYNHAYVERNSQ